MGLLLLACLLSYYWLCVCDLLVFVCVYVVSLVLLSLFGLVMLLYRNYFMGTVNDVKR